MKKRLLFLLLVFSFIFIIGCAIEEIQEQIIETEPQHEQDYTTPIINDEIDHGIETESEDFDESQRRLQAKVGPDWKFRPNWGECEDKDVTFIVAPMDLSVIKEIEPLGKTHGGHVTPTDHQYWRDDKGWDVTRPTYDVVTPADGIIVSIEKALGRLGEGIYDYRLEIWHSCSVATIFIHTTDLPVDIESAVNFKQSSYDQNRYRWGGALPVKTGQVLGKSRGSFDFSVHDTNIILSGFVYPSRYYTREPWKIHTVDPLPYFSESLQNQLKEKLPRTVEPLGGKIDYDIDGRLIGNWYLQGFDFSGFNENYKAELAIVYHHINPTQIRINIGSEVQDQGPNAFDAYGVLSNKPDPAGVSVETGLVKYELIPQQAMPGLSAEEGIAIGDSVATFLVQMLDDRTIKTEYFPDKTAAQVSGFTNNAKIYER